MRDYAYPQVGLGIIIVNKDGKILTENGIEFLIMNEGDEREF